VVRRKYRHLTSSSPSKPDFSVLDGKIWLENSRCLGPVKSTQRDLISSQPAFSAYREYH
jgi:hypothetical protein